MKASSWSSTRSTTATSKSSCVTPSTISPTCCATPSHHVAVVISDGGRRQGAYGLYEGDGATRDHHHDRIVIFRDTLRRDFGHDPEMLRDQVTRTVRHELAHHVGFDELGVSRLDL